MNQHRGKSREKTPIEDKAIAKPTRRPWMASLGWAAVLVGLGIVLSATVNPLLDRRVHWDWTAPLGVVLFALMAAALRRRWV
jgi:hypothetical protein